MVFHAFYPHQQIPMQQVHEFSPLVYLPPVPSSSHHHHHHHQQQHQQQQQQQQGNNQQPQAPTYLRVPTTPPAAPSAANNLAGAAGASVSTAQQHQQQQQQQQQQQILQPSPHHSLPFVFPLPYRLDQVVSNILVYFCHLSTNNFSNNKQISSPYKIFFTAPPSPPLQPVFTSHLQAATNKRTTAAAAIF